MHPFRRGSACVGRTTDEIAFDISAWSHWPVLQYYQIPTVSFTDVIVPMMLQMRECHEPLDKKWGCYPINPFWQDPEFGFMCGQLWTLLFLGDRPSLASEH